MSLIVFSIGVGIGALAGLILVPLFMWIYFKYKETKKRKEIKKMIDDKQMLMPIDEKDFDTEMWKDDIDLDEMKTTLENLDKKIFNRDKMEVNTNDNF